MCAFFFITIILETERAVVPDIILKKTLQQLREKKPKDDQEDTNRDSKIQEFQIWDFAGQDMYYTMHQVSILVIVVTICTNLINME